MKSIGRSSLPVVRREDIMELPVPRPLTAIYDGWEYETQIKLHGGKWKVAVNNEKGGRSYFAAVAMLIYGDSKLWFWVRIQHLQYFEQVIASRADVPHPRTELYRRMNSERSGPHNFTLEERMAYMDYWVDHQLLSQVTADLYGIYLVIYIYSSCREETPLLHGVYEQYTAIQARGNYNASHRFLRYMENRHYQPIVPAGDLIPSEYRAPKIQFPIETTNTSRSGTSPEENEDINHPWRRPLPNVPVPEPIIPPPIYTLCLKDLDAYLGRTLGIKVAVPTSLRPPTLQPRTPETSVDLDESPQAIDKATTGIQNLGKLLTFRKHASVEDPSPEMLELLPSAPPAPEYMRKSLRELERQVALRKIIVPDKVKNIQDPDTRKRRYAAFLEGSDAEKGTGGRRLIDMIDFADGPRKVTGDHTMTRISTKEERSGGVLRQITVTTFTRTITSVPSTITQTLPEAEPETPDSSSEPQQLYLHTYERLQQLLLEANLNVTGNRGVDVETYRAWMTARASPVRHGTNVVESEAQNDFWSSEKRSGGFSTVNANTHSRTRSPTRKRTSPREPEEIQDLDSAGENTYLEAEEPQSSPEPDSPPSENYSGWPALRLRKHAASLVPQIKVPWHLNAAETRRILCSKLDDLDNEARVARNKIRAEKRARADRRKDDAKLGKRPTERVKLIIKTKQKCREEVTGNGTSNIREEPSVVDKGHAEKGAATDEEQFDFRENTVLSPVKTGSDTDERMVVVTP